MEFLLNIKGQLNNIHLAEAKALWPLFEAVVNSIQAIEDSENKTCGKIEIYAHREETSEIRFDEDPKKKEETLEKFESFTITDNGVGFNTQNYESFQTAYSTHKFTKGCKGTVIRHSDGHHDGIDYLIEFDERIGNLSLEYGKNDHCFWMNKSKENGRLEKRLFMWDKPVLLECKSIKTDQIQMKNTQIFDENVEALYKMKSQEMAISNLLETIEIL